MLQQAIEDEGSFLKFLFLWFTPWFRAPYRFSHSKGYVMTSFEINLLDLKAKNSFLCTFVAAQKKVFEANYIRV